MIGKKMLSWIGAGLLSAAIAIPAIGSTVKAKSHHIASKHKVHSVVHHRKVHSAHRKPTAKTVSHTSKLSPKAKAKAVKKVILKRNAAHRTNVVHVVHKTTANHKTALVHKVSASHKVTAAHKGRAATTGPSSRA